MRFRKQQKQFIRDKMVGCRQLQTFVTILPPASFAAS